MRKSLFITILIALLSITNAFAQKNKAANPGVTASFEYCAAADNVCRDGNRLRNDLERPYVNGSEGVSTVFNLISGSKDLTIQLINSQREAVVDLTAVSSFENLPMWYATPQNVKPGFDVLQAYKAKELCGTDDTCNTNFVTVMNAGNWRVNGSSVTYALLWNPDAATRPVNSPYETSRVNVNYIKDGGGEVFLVTPLANSETNTVIAGLEGKSGKSFTGFGQFQMPFTLTVRFQ